MTPLMGPSCRWSDWHFPKQLPTVTFQPLTLTVLSFSSFLDKNSNNVCVLERPLTLPTLELPGPSRVVSEVKSPERDVEQTGELARHMRVSHVLSEASHALCAEADVTPD